MNGNLSMPLSLLPDSQFLSLDSDLFWSQRWGLPVVYVQKMDRVLSSVHAISAWPAVCAGPACVQHALSRPDSQILCCTRVLFVWLAMWPEVQSHSDDGHLHGNHSKITSMASYMLCGQALKLLYRLSLFNLGWVAQVASFIPI